RARLRAPPRRGPLGALLPGAAPPREWPPRRGDARDRARREAALARRAPEPRAALGDAPHARRHPARAPRRGRLREGVPRRRGGRARALTDLLRGALQDGGRRRERPEERAPDHLRARARQVARAPL